MSSSHFTAVMLSLGIYVFMTLAYYGWGKIVSRVTIGRTQVTNTPCSYLIWIGWAITNAVFQLIHFVLPLRAYSVLPIFIIGLALSGYLLLPKLRHVSRRTALIATGIAILILPLVYWTISRAMLVPDHIDSGLYHFQLIKWINTFPTVRGLGNLHSRLAFNQTFFFYTAALNFAPLFTHGHALANSFLFLLSIATITEQLCRTFTRSQSPLHPFQYVPGLFAFPVLVYLVINPRIPNGLAAPTPDFAASLLQLMIYIILCEVIARWDHIDTAQQYRIFFLGILGITAFANKLSSAALTLAIALYIYMYCRKHGLKRTGLTLLLIAIALGTMWVSRNLMLSGAPLYPSTAYRVPFTWSMPVNKIQQELDFIKGWARRTPFGDGSQVVIIGQDAWFLPWVEGMLKRTTEFTYPLVISTIALIAILALELSSKRRTITLTQRSVIIPILTSVVYWFVSAPDIRFAHTLIFLAASTMCMLMLTHLYQTLSARKYYVALGIVFIICNLFIGVSLVNQRDEYTVVSTSGWQSLPEESWQHIETTSGFRVVVPDDLLCWDAPLPCTPLERFDPTLAIRNPNDLGDGFIIVPAE